MHALVIQQLYRETQKNVIIKKEYWLKMALYYFKRVPCGIKISYGVKFYGFTVNTRTIK